MATKTSVWSYETTSSWGWTSSEQPDRTASTTLTLSSGNVLKSSDKITKVVYKVSMRVQRRDGGDYWQFKAVNIGSKTGTPSISNGAQISMTNYSQTISTNLNFSESDYTAFTKNTITVYDKVWTDAGEDADTPTVYNAEHYDVSVTVTYEENARGTVKYYNGSTWVNCAVYYYVDGNWKHCAPQYYDGSTWKTCNGS